MIQNCFPTNVLQPYLHTPSFSLNTLQLLLGDPVLFQGSGCEGMALCLYVASALEVGCLHNQTKVPLQESPQPKSVNSDAEWWFTIKFRGSEWLTNIMLRGFY